MPCRPASNEEPIDRFRRSAGRLQQWRPCPSPLAETVVPASRRVPRHVCLIISASDAAGGVPKRGLPGSAVLAGSFKTALSPGRSVGA